MEELDGWIYSVVLVVFIFFFLLPFVIEDRKCRRRHKLWDQLRFLLKKRESKCLKEEREEIEEEIYKTWKEYEILWEKFRYKKITEKQTKEMERFLITEGILPSG